MATSQSFNAEGPTVSAFETTGLTPSDVPAFGVAVYAHKCGVNGVAFADVPAGAHLIAPDLVGVHGKGDNEGVQGEGPIGVHGIAAGAAPGTIIPTGIGVQGDGGQIGVFGTSETGVLGRGLTGVRGESGSGGMGVSGSGAVGVKGTGTLAGVHGASEESRGGIFQTGKDTIPELQRAKHSAQVLLVPVEVTGFVQAHLPRNGHAGDLLAMSGSTPGVVPGGHGQRTAVELWFCIQSAGPLGAMWARVQFDAVVTVT